MTPLLHGAFNHGLLPGSSVFLIHVLDVEGVWIVLGESALSILFSLWLNLSTLTRQDRGPLCCCIQHQHPSQKALSRMGMELLAQEVVFVEGLDGSFLLSLVSLWSGWIVVSRDSVIAW